MYQKIEIIESVLIKVKHSTHEKRLVFHSSGTLFHMINDCFLIFYSLCHTEEML
jgi:hypothetical protein